MAERQPTCETNPATGKPFTRHHYAQEGLRVESYKTMHDGESVPGVYAFELVCQRCGFTQTVRY